MQARELRQQRLINLGIAAARGTTPGEVVSTLCALQGQDYNGALWAIGLRLPAATLDDVRQAIVERAVVRTWPMRGTLHFVAAADVHWLLELLTARVIASSAKRHRDLALDAKLFARAEKVLVRALEGGKQLTREGVRDALARAKLSLEGDRLYHVICFLAQQRVLCCGAHEGKQGTFTLLPEWVPAPKRQPSREEALALLAERYFDGHGPATAADLARWAGITLADVKLGLAGAAKRLTSETGDDGETLFRVARAPQPTAAERATYLLPGFDEYMLGYKDRGLIVTAEHANAVVPGGNGMFKATIVDDGRVIGTWKATPNKRAVQIAPTPFAALSAVQRKRLARPVERYGKFLGKEATLLAAD